MAHATMGATGRASSSVAEKPRYWDRHSDADRTQFARFLDPLVIAAWPSPEMRRKHFSKVEAQVYMITLLDVPREILALGVTKLLEDGVTWMPKPGDIKAACADVVDSRRKVLAEQAQRMLTDCGDCQGTGWRNAEGPNAVESCSCKKRAAQLMATADHPIQRPALPESTERPGQDY